MGAGFATVLSVWQRGMTVGVVGVVEIDPRSDCGCLAWVSHDERAEQRRNPSCRGARARGLLSRQGMCARKDVL
jgi:hypothetical protein